MSNSSLSSVVSNLVRASLGTSVGPSVTNEALDRHVADLILKEAKQKEERYLGKDGIRAYQPEPESNLFKPNKRFLSSIIRNVDDHNSAIIQSQVQAAAEAKEEIRERERRMMRARADEAAKDRLRRLMGTGTRRSSERHSRDDQRRSEQRTRHSKLDREKRSPDPGPSSSRNQLRIFSSDQNSSSKRKGRCHRETGGHSLHHKATSSNRRSRERTTSTISGSDVPRHYRHKHEPRGRSRSRDKDKRNLNRKHGEDDTDWKKKHTRWHSRSPSGDPGSHPRTPSTPQFPPSPPDSGTLKSNSHEPHPLSHPLTHRTRSPSPASPVYSGPPPEIPSKMDRYFDPAYDPLLDTYPNANLTLNDPIPEGAFDHWNNMLELIKMRKEDKAERKLREKEEKRRTKKRKRGESLEQDEDAKRDRRIQLGLERPSLMDMKYAKRGSIREWDVGKEVI